MLRLKGLQDHLASQRAPPGPPGYLGQNLECPLVRPVIRQVESDISQHDPHQRHQRQIHPFGKHLRADQHIRLMGRKLAQDRFMGALPAGGLVIPAQRAGLREKRLQIGFHLLRAGAVLADALRCRSSGRSPASSAGSRSSGSTSVFSAS